MRPPGDDYTLDDLVAHEKKNTKLVAVLFVGAVLVVGGRQMLSQQESPSRSSPAPVTSTTGR